MSNAGIQDLADELLRQLAARIGDEDPDAMDAVFRRWLDVLEVPRMYLVGLAALRAVFVDCLTLTNPADWPSHGIALVVNTEEDT